MLKLKSWVLKIIVAELQVGAHCGLCGAWMEHEITYKAWPWAVCKKCALQESE